MKSVSFKYNVSQKYFYKQKEKKISLKNIILSIILPSA